MAPKGKKKGAKRAAKPQAPKASKGSKVSLFRSKAKNFGVGGDILPKTKNLGRALRWPKYIRIQRQKKILLERLKVPPAVNVFSKTADKSFAKELFSLFLKYRPETSQQKKQRQKEAAKAKAEGNEADQGSKPFVTKFGLNHITKLIEEKKAALVLIAHDVDPLEIVLWLPTLCTQYNVPFAIVKGRSRLGTIVHQRNATCLALTQVKKEDQNSLKKLAEKANDQFNNRMDAFKKEWGQGVLGPKARARNKKLEAIRTRAAQQARRL